MKQHSQENVKLGNFELSNIRDKARDHNLKSITNIAIHGPVSAEEKLGITSEDSFSMCQKICQKLESNQIIHPSLFTADSYVTNRTTFKISTGSSKLNGLLNGGIESRAITEFYGPPGVGKTQLCFTLCVMNLEDKFKAIYIDTEQKFRPERIEVIARNRNYQYNVLNNILLVKPLNTAHFEDVIIKSFNTIQEDESIKLLILDSLVSLYQSEFIGRKNLVERQNRLGRILKTLSAACEVYNIAVVITNHVQSSADSFAIQTMNPTGGYTMGHLITHRIFLTASGNRRRAKIINSPCLPPDEAIFCISNEGITDYSDIEY